MCIWADNYPQKNALTAFGGVKYTLENLLGYLALPLLKNPYSVSPPPPHTHIYSAMPNSYSERAFKGLQGWLLPFSCFLLCFPGHQGGENEAFLQENVKSTLRTAVVLFGESLLWFARLLASNVESNKLVSPPHTRLYMEPERGWKEQWQIGFCIRRSSALYMNTEVVSWLVVFFKFF